MAKAQTIFDSGAGTLRLQENDVNMDADGGRVVLVADANTIPKELQKSEELGSITLVLNYRDDEPMKKWPVGREDRARRRFRVVITEEEAE